MQVVEYDLSTILFLFNLVLIFKDDIIGQTILKFAFQTKLQTSYLADNLQRNRGSCISKFKCLSSYKTIIQNLDVKHRI